MNKIVIARWILKAAEAPRILALLPDLAQKSRNEKGNISYSVYQSETNPNEIIIHEQYVDAAAADAHRNSEHFQRIVLHEIVPHLERREVAVAKQLC